MVRAGTGLGEVVDHLGDLLAVGHGRVDALLGLHDARAGDELHGARDLLRGLHRTDAVPQDAFLASGHPGCSLLRGERLGALGLAQLLGLDGREVEGGRVGRGDWKLSLNSVTASAMPSGSDFSLAMWSSRSR